jgi:hypothetical protein
MPSDKSAQALLTVAAAKVSRVEETLSSIRSPSEKVESVINAKPYYEIINYDAEHTLHESSAVEMPVISEAKIKEIS